MTKQEIYNLQTRLTGIILCYAGSYNIPALEWMQNTPYDEAEEMIILPLGPDFHALAGALKSGELDFYHCWHFAYQELLAQRYPE